jgi:stage III sporulation protein AG
VINGVPFFQGANATPTPEEEATEFQDLKKVLQKIDGVGDVELFIYSGKTSETESKNNLPNFTLFNEQTSKEREIQSILVVAAGADNIQIQNKLKQYLSSVFILPQHRIVVVPMDEKGVLK